MRDTYHLLCAPTVQIRTKLRSLSHALQNAPGVCVGYSRLITVLKGSQAIDLSIYTVYVAISRPAHCLAGCAPVYSLVLLNLLSVLKTRRSHNNLVGSKRSNWYPTAVQSSPVYLCITAMGRSKNWMKWDENEVGRWLKDNGLEEFAAAFVENKIKGKDLTQVDEDSLAGTYVAQVI